MGSSPVVVTSTSDFVPVSSKKFVDIQATIECGFTLKRVHDMIRIESIINDKFWIRTKIAKICNNIFKLNQNYGQTLKLW